MNRYLKFRVWDTVGKKFMEIYSVDLLDADYLNNPEYVIQQFTGLHDNNGKEIFEGDILEINYSNGHERDSSYDIQGKFEVVFQYGEWRAVGINLWGNDEETGYSVWGHTSDYSKRRGVECEVIGNIFENHIEGEE